MGKVDVILSGGIILTMDAQFSLFAPGTVAALALEFDIPLQIHVAEPLTEQEQMQTTVGMRPVPWIKKQTPRETFPDFVIGKSSRRQQFDTYFIFHDKWASRLRYREDEIMARDTPRVEPVSEGQVSEVIYRLTLANEAKEREYVNSAVLSHLHFTHFNIGKEKLAREDYLSLAPTRSGSSRWREN